MGDGDDEVVVVVVGGGEGRKRENEAAKERKREFSWSGGGGDFLRPVFAQARGAESEFTMEYTTTGRYSSTLLHTNWNSVNRCLHYYSIQHHHIP